MTSGTRKIFVVRHGETEYNRLGIIQGRGIDSDINITGKAQANAFFKAWHHEKFDAIYTSTLKRTAQTADPWKQAGYDLITDAGLDEIDWGHHEGQKPDKALRQEYQYILRCWALSQLDVAAPGGESPIVLQERQLDFLHRLMQEDWQQVLLFSHGRAIRSLLCLLTGISAAKMDEFHHQNLSLYVLAGSALPLKCLVRNDLSHLELATSE